MNSDTVQIGSLILSKGIFDALMVMLGVIIGGLITYLTTRAIENKRWETQKHDRLQEHRREALALALEWIPPIQLALSRASMLASRYLQNQATYNDVCRQWPDLLHDLAIRDLPMRLNVLVPSTIQKRTDDIISQLGELQSFTLSAKPMNKGGREEWMKQFRLFSKQASIVEDQFRALKEELKSEHAKTFE